MKDHFRGIPLLKTISVVTVARTIPKQQPFTFCNVWPDANLALKQTKPRGGVFNCEFPYKKVWFWDWLRPENKHMSEIQANNVPFARGIKPLVEICDLLWTVTNRPQQIMQRPGIVGICGAPPTPGVRMDRATAKVWHKSHRKSTKPTSRCWEFSLRACSLFQTMKHACSIL